MTEWLWFFIPLWVGGFFIGLYAGQINKLLDEPKAFVLKER